MDYYQMQKQLSLQNAQFQNQQQIQQIKSFQPPSQPQFPGLAQPQNSSLVFGQDNMYAGTSVRSVSPLNYRQEHRNALQARNEQQFYNSEMKEGDQKYLSGQDKNVQQKVFSLYANNIQLNREDSMKNSMNTIQNQPPHQNNNLNQDNKKPLSSRQDLNQNSQDLMMSSYSDNNQKLQSKQESQLNFRHKNFTRFSEIQTNQDRVQHNSSIYFGDAIEAESLKLKQQLTQLNYKIQQLNKSQNEVLGLNFYANNKSVLVYLEQQLQSASIQKKLFLEQIDSLQTLQMAYFKFNQIYPDAHYQKFINLSRETQLLFLQAPFDHSLNNSTSLDQKKQSSSFNMTSSDQNCEVSENSQCIKQESNQQEIHQYSEVQYTQPNHYNLDIQQQEQAFLYHPLQNETIVNNQFEQNQGVLAYNVQIEDGTINSIEESIPNLKKESEIIQKNDTLIEQTVENESRNYPNDEGEHNHIHENVIEEQNDNDENEDEEEEEEDDEEELAGIKEEQINLQINKQQNCKKSEKRMEKLEENVLRILEQLEDACSKIKPIAVELCEKIAREKNKLKNRPYEAIAAAIIVHASRLIANPITVKQMAKITECKEKIINRVFMYLKKNVDGFNNKMPQPDVFIKNICDKMQLTPALSETALFLHKQSDLLGLVKGQHAATVAACLVKLAASLNTIDMPVKQICEASNVCQISLRSLYRQIYPHRFELIGDHTINGLNLKQLLAAPHVNLE